jgi:hypothetical protein
MGTGKRRINSAVRVLLIVLVAELEHAQVAVELEHAPVAAQLAHDPAAAELAHDPVAEELAHAQAVAERVHVPVEAVLEPGLLRAQPAVALRTKSVIGAHRRDLVPIAAVDLAAAAETTRVPAATGAVVAWAAADIAVAAAAEDAAAEE